MFGLVITKSQLLADVQRSKAVPTTIWQPDTFTEEYTRVAQRIGFAVTPTTTHPFRRWLSDEAIACYNEAKVGRYLNRELGRNGRRTMEQTWLWRPMRRADTMHHVDGAYHPLSAWVCATATVNPNGTPYAKPVPLPVLLTVEKVLTTWPAARFYISDTYTEQEREEERQRVRDPFLLAVVGREHYIIERWDEPRFRP